MAKAKKKALKSRVRTAEKKAGRAAKRTGAKIERGVKKAARKTKTFAKTKTGYTAGGAGIGALALGPLGAIAGAIGGSALHDNPGGDLGDIIEVEAEFWSDDRLKEEWENVHEIVTTVKHPTRQYGTEGWPMLQRMHTALKKEMVSRGFLSENPGKATKRNPATRKQKPATRKRKAPAAADHERVGMDALSNSEKFHKRYLRYGRTNDLLDTYQWIIIAHEELKYSDKEEPRIQAREGLKAVRRELLKVIL
jgi:hypothetical protein